MPTMSISWTDSNFTGLITAAKETGLNKSQIANRALEMYLKELKEDTEDAAVGEKAWNDFAASGEKGFTIEECKKELGL